jgi:hypothetical protein
MTWLVAIVLAPIVLALFGVYVVLKMAALMLRLIFAPLALRRR